MRPIFIVVNSLSGGGAEKSMLHLASHFLTNKSKVTVIPINASELDFPNFDLPIVEINRQWRGSVVNLLISLVKFRQVVRSEKDAVFILNCELPELFSICIPRKSKVVCVEHTTNPWKSKRLVGFLVRKILMFRKAIWVRVSDHIKPWPANLKYSQTIPNPIVIEERKQFSSRDVGRLVFIGRLSPEKNPSILLDISKILNLPVLFIGDGIERVDLEERAEVLGIESEFVGFLAHPWRRLKQSDLLVVPSLYEGDGLVALEAIALGVPLIISRIPEFERFGLPSQNYFASVSDFVEKFTQHRNSRDFFKVPLEAREKIIGGRNLRIVGSAWIKLLGRC